eukprot:9146167-Lingulodinium_polyedra.AAC.1
MWRSWGALSARIGPRTKANARRAFFLYAGSGPGEQGSFGPPARTRVETRRPSPMWRGSCIKYAFV